MNLRPSPLFIESLRQAIREGRKTQTRRVMAIQPKRIHSVRADGAILTERLFRRGNHFIMPPHGGPGDLWYLREPLRRSDSGIVTYADDHTPVWLDGQESVPWSWDRRYLPSMLMIRWAGRTFLLVQAVRTERLQDISEADAIAEGFPDPPGTNRQYLDRARYWFRNLWDSINGQRRGCAWLDNPWVWVYEFSLTEKPQ